MKRIAYILAVVAILGLTTATYADLESSAVAKVYATVNPNVAVNYDNGVVDAGTIQTGLICADIVFRIDANKESVQIFVEASDLWKGDDPTNSEVAPILLAQAEGATIDPVNANPLGSGSNIPASSARATRSWASRLSAARPSGSRAPRTTGSART
jgi:hypothetical protein